MNNNNPVKINELLSTLEKKYADYTVQLAELADALKNSNLEKIEAALKQCAVLQHEIDSISGTIPQNSTLTEYVNSQQNTVSEKESAKKYLVKIKRLVKYACELETNCESLISNELHSVKSSISHVQKGKNLKQIYKNFAPEPRFLDKRR